MTDEEMEHDRFLMSSKGVTVEPPAERLNSMCVDCPHLGKVCGGTTSEVWTGCILKDRPTKEAREYIEHMSEIVKGEQGK